MGYQDMRAVGDRLWFEYHCTEQHTSEHALLWYHSHQQVTVLGFADGMLDPNVFEADCETFALRCGSCCQFLYRVEFEDGFVAEVFEDELLNSPEEYERPDPPTGPEEVT